MSDASDQVSNQAKFKAREFVARWYRETGEAPNFTVSDRMLFAYEIGYMRGRSDGAEAATKMFTETP